MLRPDLESHAKERRLKPKADEMVRAFGEGSYKEGTSSVTGNKRWRVRVEKKDFGKLAEMMKPAWQESARRGRNLESQVPKVALSDGSTVAEWTAEEVCRKSGARERVRRRPTARYLATEKGLVRIV